MTTWTRIRRSLRWGIGLAVLSWFFFILVTRWDITPAARSQGGAEGSPPIDATLDRTHQLNAALSATPPLPPIQLFEPPAGMAWGDVSTTGGLVDIPDAAYGEWAPEKRPNQRSVIQFIESPAVTQMLAQLSAIEPGDVGQAIAITPNMRTAIELLMVRARLNHAGRGDVAAATADLATGLKLTKMLMRYRDPGNLLRSVAFTSALLEEVHLMAFERQVSRADAAAAIAIIRQTTLEAPAMWEAVVSVQVDVLTRLLDQTYSNDGAGNGWFALSDAEPPRCGAWNALSIFYNDRRTIESKIARYRAAIEALGPMTYPEARQAVRRTREAAAAFGILDGPMFKLWADSSGFYHRMVFRIAVSRSAGMTEFALSAYKFETGRLPDSLDDLVAGKYLAEIPRDPDSGGPLRYRLTSDGEDYLLYGVGPNGVDDGGAEPSRRFNVAAEDRDGDVVIHHARRKPFSEVELLQKHD
ncbi:MAG TPA: hypothetical protein PK093_03980 [Phycisphaerae bacterium]|nr:hypothetical protein [Phycisphaerae bacterium]